MEMMDTVLFTVPDWLVLWARLGATFVLMLILVFVAGTFVIIIQWVKLRVHEVGIVVCLSEHRYWTPMMLLLTGCFSAYIVWCFGKIWL